PMSSTSSLSWAGLSPTFHCFVLLVRVEPSVHTLRTAPNPNGRSENMSPTVRGPTNLSRYHAGTGGIGAQAGPSEPHPDGPRAHHVFGRSISRGDPVPRSTARHRGAVRCCPDRPGPSPAAPGHR